LGIGLLNGEGERYEHHKGVREAPVVCR